MIDTLERIESGIYAADRVDEGAPYDNKAKMYEFLVGTWLYNKIAWGTRPEDYRDFAAMALEESNGNILDVGCGGLTHTAALYAGVKDQLVLADNSIAMLRLAKKRLLETSGQLPASILLLKADAFALPFHEEMDSLFSFGMLHLFEDKAGFLDCMFKTLRPGGKFFFSSLTTDRPFSKKYINFLHRQGEMSSGLSAAQTLDLFKGRTSGISYYQAGSMVFISGIKKRL